MWKLHAKLGDWYIVVIALVLIGGFFSPHQSSSTAPAAAVIQPIHRLRPRRQHRRNTSTRWAGRAGRHP
jgi:hypothetical protein